MPTNRLFHADFVKSALNLEDCPQDDALEIAFAGRSNAGKSSMLNRITGNKMLARVSKTPGRTQLLNFFVIPNEGRFVDLPGYGYAKVSKTDQANWGDAVNDFLEYRKNLVGLVIVSDARRLIPPVDQQMISWCISRELPFLLILNKIDKTKQQERNQAQREAQLLLANHPQATFLAFSAKTGHGTNEVVAHIRSMFNAQ